VLGAATPIDVINSFLKLILISLQLFVNVLQFDPCIFKCANSIGSWNLCLSFIPTIFHVLWSMWFLFIHFLTYILYSILKIKNCLSRLFEEFFNLFMFSFSMRHTSFKIFFLLSCHRFETISLHLCQVVLYILLLISKI